MTSEQISNWMVENSATSERARLHLIRILERGPIHPAALGEFRREYDLPQPIAAWLSCFPKDFVRTAKDPRSSGQPSVALVSRAVDPEYWKNYRTVASDGAETHMQKQRHFDSLAWGKLQLKGDNPTAIRAEIFRAFLLNHFGRKSVDMVEATSCFRRYSGMSFRDFFGGLSAREIAMQDWGTAYCAWTPLTATSMSVVPVNFSGDFVVNELSSANRSSLEQQARKKVPERIDFVKLCSEFGVSRETVLLSYLEALSTVLSGGNAAEHQKQSQSAVAFKTAQTDKMSIVEYLKRLGRAIIGRSGQCRTRYLKKWVGFLCGNPDQDAKIACVDGRVLVGPLLDADDDYFTVKVGSETIFLPTSDIVEIKGVDRAVVDKKSDAKPKTEQRKIDAEVEMVGYAGMGRVTAWKNSEYGFVVAGPTTYHFSRSKVEDSDLLVALDSGQTDQRVSFVVIAPRSPGYKYPSIKISQWCESHVLIGDSYGQHKYYALGRAALHAGNLAGAKVYFTKVLENPQDENYLSALKDLADLVSRTDPNKAYDLIEQHRTGFPAEVQQLGFDRMEITFLLKAERSKEATTKIESLLQRNDLESNLREHYEKLLEQARGSVRTNDGGNVGQDDPYAELLMRQCDFHGLEDEGIRKFEDLPDEDDSARQTKLLELQKRFKANWDLFCAEVRPQERKLYRDIAFSREQLRFQLTDVCLHDALGSAVPMGFSLRFYLWRKLQCMVYEQPNYSVPEVLAYLVLVARLNVQTRTFSRYWQTALPLLICHVIIGSDGEELRRIVEDEEYRNALLADFPMSDESKGRIVCVVRMLQLDRLLPEFKGIFDRLGVSGDEDDGGYASWISALKVARVAVGENLSMEGVERLSDVLSHSPEIPQLDRTRVEHVMSLLSKAGDFVRSEDYEQRVRLSCEIRRMVGEFEQTCVLSGLTVPTYDALYPVESAVRDAVADASSRAEVAPLEICIEHAGSSIYYHDGGRVSMDVRVRAVNSRLPPVSDISLRVVGREGSDAEVVFSGPLRGGTDHVFQIGMDITEDEIVSGHGVAELCLEYTRESEDREREVVSKRLEFGLEDDEFEPIANPYVKYTRHPVKGRLFVGREKMLGEISDVFDSDRGGHCYILFGQRRSGKTSMMKNLEKILIDKHFVYTQMSAAEWVDDCALERFANALESKVAESYSFGVQPEGGARGGDPMSRIRMLSRALKQECGVLAHTWVVAIDEFTYLHDYYLKAPDLRRENVLQFLRALKALLEEKVFHLLLIGQESVVQMQREFANELAIWHLHRLTYLQEGDVRRLADEPTYRRRDNGDLESRYKGRAFARLYELTAGQPWLTLQFCSAIVEFLNEHKASDITDRVIDAVCNNMCIGDSKLADETFEPFVHLMDPSIDGDEVLRLYYLLAELTRDATDYVSLERLSDSQKAIIPMLERRGLVCIHDESVRLRMGLFAAWLRVNPGRTKECFGKGY